MSSHDAALVRSLLRPETSTCLDAIDAFKSIESTNTYLLGRTPPLAGRFAVAIADEQTSGRGRHTRRWVSPHGAGLYLSFAYSFAQTPQNMTSLTLAVGAGIVTLLHDLGVNGVQLKWPNDMVALGGKLGGILTEVMPRRGETSSVVVGLGLNIDLPADAETSIESDWARRPVDMKQLMAVVPATEIVAAAVIEGLFGVMKKFTLLGFAGFADEWAAHDWLRGREIVVDMPHRQITGIAAGVAADGALLIDTGTETTRVVSGSIVMAAMRGFV
jgi:BirA family biotin operon repressor/biotin-[acetyl-CoA-carboxylase] ligase